MEDIKDDDQKIDDPTREDDEAKAQTGDRNDSQDTSMPENNQNKAVDPNRMMTPEEIAQLVAQETDNEEASEEIADNNKEESVGKEPAPDEIE